MTVPSASVLVADSTEQAGVLPHQMLERAIESGVIAGTDGSEVPRSNIQPASLDLRLGGEAFRLRCSFLPDKHPVERKLQDVVMDSIDLSGGGAVLERMRPYLIPLKERLQLPDGIRARANPKSSTGRADVFTRVITDHSYSFDEIADGYSGRLYLEVVPLSFAVRVNEGLSLNQLRLSLGQAKLSDAELMEFHATRPLLLRGGAPVSDQRFAVSNGLFLGLNLKGDKRGQVGYRAKSHAPLLDLTAVRAADPAQYWDPVMKDVGGDRVVLEPRAFYLLMSDEAVTIPPTLAAEMTAYDPTAGELRTHYAGFFDPGFGFGGSGPSAGSTAALEVRAHDVPFMIEHRQRVCKLTFERMLEPPTTLYGQDIGSNYQGQSSALGKHFKLPTSDRARPATAEADAEQTGQLELLGSTSEPESAST